LEVLDLIGFDEGGFFPYLCLFATLTKTSSYFVIYDFEGLGGLFRGQ
jgi:hypothetical protein